jgi:hypothetical protein
MTVENNQGYYEVIVSNIGKVLEGSNAFKANSAFNTYVGQSKRGYGRAAGESVTMFRNGEPVKEFTGSLHMTDD